MRMLQCNCEGPPAQASQRGQTLGRRHAPIGGVVGGGVRIENASSSASCKVLAFGLRHGLKR
jgi:hypothetical protein